MLLGLSIIKLFVVRYVLIYVQSLTKQWLISLRFLLKFSDINEMDVGPSG